MSDLLAKEDDLLVPDASTVEEGAGGVLQIKDGGVALAKWASGVLDTDGTLAANSDSKVASQKATKTYVDAHAGGSLSYVSSILGSDQALTNGSYIDIVTVSLAAGTWLLFAQAQVYRTGGNAEFTAQIWDKASSVVASTEVRNPSGTVTFGLALAGIVAVGSTTSYYLSIACNQTSCVCAAATTTNPAGNTGSLICGIKIA